MKKIIAIVLGLATIVLAICILPSCSRGGTSFILEITPDQNDNTDTEKAEELLINCRQKLLERCSLVGIKDVEIQPVENESQSNRLSMKIHHLSNIERIKKLLTNSVEVGFWEMYAGSEVLPYITSADKRLRILLADKNKDKQIVEKEYPLLCRLQISTDSISQQPLIGYANGRDTATINQYLNIPEIKAMFPTNLVLKWKAFSYDYEKKEDTFELYALKVTEKNGKAPLTEDVIVDALSAEDNYGRPCLSIVMNTYGSKRWAQMTRNNIGRAIAIVLNDQIYSVPTVCGEITGGRSEISGNFSKEEAQDMAYMLKSGNLHAKVKIIDIKITPDKQ